MTSRSARHKRTTLAVATVAAAGALATALATSASAQPAAATADAVVLKTDLDVSLANKSAQLPLNVSLNEVHAPADAKKTLLTGRLDGVAKGRPFSIVHADVATAKVTADATKAEGYANLTKATVHVPGLPLLGLIKVNEVTSKATCATGQAPTASTNFVGDVTVLGRKVSLRAAGATMVKVPGVGEASLELSKMVRTSASAASTALRLTVHVNPGKLNVAEVTGDITLVKANCQAPDGTGGSDGGSSTGGSPTGSTGGGNNLAETGGRSSTPYIAGGAAVLVAVGGGAIYLSRRKKASV
jgi:LPXTG-motif cell wall-anchored protein